MPRHSFNGRLFNAAGVCVKVAISDTEQGIMLEVIGDASELYESRLDELTLESSGGRGLLRTRGSGRRVDRNQIRFFRDDAACLVQRRQFVRIMAAQRIRLSDEEGASLCDALAVNISGGGALISLPRRRERIPGLENLRADDRLRFALHLRDGEEPVRGLGTVMRVLADERIAITFSEIARRDRERVIRFVFDRERAAIALTRGDAD